MKQTPCPETQGAAQRAQIVATEGAATGRDLINLSQQIQPGNRAGSQGSVDLLQIDAFFHD